MSQSSDTIVIMDLPDENWYLVDPFGNNVAITIKNGSSTSVSVFKTTEDIELGHINDYLTSNNINPPEIGGLMYEISTIDGEKLYARCNEGSGQLSVRKYGTIDPSTDVESLGDSLNKMLLEFNNHITDADNPHVVTKDQVGLENIPSDITDDILTEEWTPENDKDVLISLKGARQLYDFLKQHQEDVSNPHEVSKSDVGLSNVANYPPATQDDAMDANNDGVYLTPHSAVILLKNLSVISSSVLPQLVVRGNTGDRPESWTMSDSTLPSNTIVKLGSTKISVEAGLQVTYTGAGMSKLSNILVEPITFDFPPDMGTITQYLYVDLLPNGDFSTVGYKPYPPVTASMKDAYTGDLFNTSTYEMTDADGKQLSRIYLAKINFKDHAIQDIVCVPIGLEAIIPIEVDIPLGTSFIMNNPYLAPVSSTALLRLDGVWGETKWNDQTGIIASPRPMYENTQIVVQAGLVGYVTKGSSSGNAFGSNFTTITEPQRMAVKLRKLY